MKLINKTQRIYLSLVLVLMLVWSGAFLWAIYGAIRENVDETLHSELLSIVRHYQQEESIDMISAVQIEITTIPNIENSTLTLSDTTLYNAVEEEPFPYRQAIKQFRIGDQAYQLILRRSMVEYDDLFEAILFMELIFMLLLLGGLVVINRKILHRLWEPFNKTLQQLNDYRIAGDEEMDWPDTDVDEFNQLNSVLKEMMGRIENEYKQLKQFTENASHEIQTPLAVIQNQIEMLIQEESFSEDQGKRLQKISTMAGKLSRLNRALLLLTKIENEQYADRQPINITDLLHSLTEEYHHLAEARDLTMQVDLEPEVTVRMNPDLAEMLFRNLLSNAIKHNVEDGYIKISLDEKRLTIKNTGKPPVGEPQKYLERFQKGGDSINSLGLGLSIVAAIAKANDFDLQYIVKKDVHILQLNYTQ